MTNPDHPELAFVQASGYTKGRPDGPPLWIVVHDMEANETATTAEATANYFATGAGGRSVSSHYTADSNSVVQCVFLQDVAWTVGNRPGNYRGINWEFAGFASQSREEWLDAFGVAMFNQAAPIIRSDAARFGIPLVRCTIDDLLEFRPGVTSHNDLRIAFNVTDHTDPGPNFPWDWFIALLTDEEDSMSTEDSRRLWIIGNELESGLVRLQDPIVIGARPDLEYAGATVPNRFAQVLQGIAEHAGMTPEQYAKLLADVAGAAEKGAEAGAPSEQELEDAAFRGAQRAEDA